MTLRWMYDASTPPSDPPKWYAVAGYIGGDTPHVWTEAEWNAQSAKYRLPIYTATGRDDTVAAAGPDAWNIYHALKNLGVPSNCSVAIDIETDVYITYLQALEVFLEEWKVIVYGSLSTLLQCAETSGGRWAGDWTDNIDTAVQMDGTENIVALQWASATMLGKSYDASVIEETIPLWSA